MPQAKIGKGLLMLGAFNLALILALTVLFGTAGAGSASTAHIVLRVVTADSNMADAMLLQSTQRIIARRIAGVSTSFGFSDDGVRAFTVGSRQYITVTLHGIEPKELPETALSLQGRGQLTIVALNKTVLPRGASAAGYEVLARSSDLNSGAVDAGVDSFGVPAIDLQVTGRAATRLDAYSATHIGSFIGIAIDGRILKSQQVVQAFPQGNLQVTNLGTTMAVRNLAAELKYGVLPLPLAVAHISATAS